MSLRLRSTTAILPAFLVPLGVYVASLQGDVAGWDTADLQTVPYILGIPYPTGFPGYVLLGWVWSHALPLGSVAWRLNLLGAVASAGTAAALAALLLELGASVPIAFATAGAYALAGIPWSHATYVDVHPIAFCAVAWAAVTAQRSDPTLVLGVPPGRPYWDDGHPATWDGFRRVVTGSDFHPQAALAQIAGPRALGAFSVTFAPGIARELGWPFAACAIVGWVWLAGRKPQVAVGLALLGILPVLFAGAYVVESVPARYYLPGYFAIAIAAAAGYAVAGLDAALSGPRRAALLGALALAWSVQIAVDVGAGARRPLVVVSAVPLTFPGFRVRDLGDGGPHLYALR